MVTFALRAFSLAFLAWHLGLLFPGLAEPVFLALAAVAGLAGGSAVRQFKAWIALPTGAAAYAAAQFVLNLPAWLTGSGPSPLDQLPLWAERQFAFAALPFALAWFEGWLFRPQGAGRGWERLVNAAALVLVFWSQGPYHVTLYPHPLGLALALALFLTSELILLAGKPPRLKGAAWVAVLLVAVLGSAWLWSLLGRYEDQSTASGGGLMKPDLFQFDFAPLIKLEDEITLGENLVLLYREEGPAKARYLRRLVLDAYGAQGFSVSGGKAPTVGRRPQTFPAPATRERTPVRQEYYLVNLDPSSMLVLNEPVSVTPYAQWNHSSFVNAYRVESRVETEAYWQYAEQTGDGLTAEQRAFFTRGGDDPEIRRLAVQVTVNAATPYEKAAAIELYLRDNYFYSLKPGAPGPRGPLKHFLFEGKKGYCSYFAFAMTLMLRSLGVPARIAVGFATDPAEAVLGFTPVRAFQAHAWVEVPAGDYGWLNFDPTSNTPAPGEPFRFPKATDPQELSKMIAEILDAKPQPLTVQPAPVAQRPVWEQLWERVPSLWWLVPLVLILANEAWRHRWLWARLGARDSRRRAALVWSEVAAHARRAGTGPRPGETPEAWALRIANRFPDLEGFVGDVSRARYARDLPPDLEPRVREAASQARRRFDASRPAVHRAAAAVFPWWPR